MDQGEIYNIRPPEGEKLSVQFYRLDDGWVLVLSPPETVRFIEDLITGLEKLDPLRAERFGRRRMG
jgi:hypothetical protein